MTEEPTSNFCSRGWASPRVNQNELARTRSAVAATLDDLVADERAVRWWWEQDTEKECGIHITPSGQLMRQVDALIAEISPAAH